MMNSLYDVKIINCDDDYLPELIENWLIKYPLIKITILAETYYSIWDWRVFGE